MYVNFGRETESKWQLVGSFIFLIQISPRNIEGNDSEIEETKSSYKNSIKKR